MIDVIGFLNSIYLIDGSKNKQFHSLADDTFNLKCQSLDLILVAIKRLHILRSLICAVGQVRSTNFSALSQFWRPFTLIQI